MTVEQASGVHTVSVGIGCIHELLTPEQALTAARALIEVSGIVAAENDHERRHREYEAAQRKEHHGRI